MDSQDKQIKWKYVESVHMHYDVNVDVVCRRRLKASFPASKIQY